MANFNLKKLFGIPKSKTAEEIAQENAFKGDIKKATGSLKSEDIEFNNYATGLNSENVQTAIEEVKDIAIGARLAIVFNTEDNMHAWIAGEYVRPDGLLPTDLKIGENIYIVDINVPDYWWDGTQVQMLETKDTKEIINLIKPDTIEDIAAFKGVTAKTASYTSTLSVALDGITIKISGGGSSSAGTLSCINNTGGWILFTQFHLYDSVTDSSSQTLIQDNNTLTSNSIVGYTNGMIYRVKIGTYQGKLYEGDVFLANGTNTTGITACAMRLRRVV
ncbi:MAG: hypothetical protein LBG21_06305 [Campylobacteraceae bacterium]|jgi:hypothetical protein|nr:hypothetical protein [Campylobacteraceae bacterium]